MSEQSTKRSSGESDRPDQQHSEPRADRRPDERAELGPIPAAIERAAAAYYKGCRRVAALINRVKHHGD